MSLGIPPNNSNISYNNFITDNESSDTSKEGELIVDDDLLIDEEEGDLKVDDGLLIDEGLMNDKISREETHVLVKKFIEGQLPSLVLYDIKVLEEIALNEGENKLGSDTELVNRITYESGRQEYVVRGETEALFQQALENQQVSYYAGIDADPVALDSARVTVRTMSEAEYDRFYQATYNSLQDLVNLHKALQENLEKIEAGEQLIDPSRVKSLARVVKNSEKEKTAGNEKRSDQARKAEAERKDIENIASAKAEQKKRYQRVLQELEFMFQIIHTTNRNRHDAEKMDIRNRSIKTVNNHSPHTSN